MAAGRPEAQDHPPENGFTPLENPVPRLLPHIDGSVLPSLGGFGKHQKQLVVLTWIPALFIGFSQFSDYFLLAQPNGTCVQPLSNHSNWTSASPPVTVTGGAPALLLNGSGTGEGYGDNIGLLCACKEWRLELQTGLSQNVVTKVTSEHQIDPQCYPYVHLHHHHHPHHPVSVSSLPGSVWSRAEPHTQEQTQLIDKLPTDLNMRGRACVRACVSSSEWSYAVGCSMRAFFNLCMEDFFAFNLRCGGVLVLWGHSDWSSQLQRSF